MSKPEPPDEVDDLPAEQPTARAINDEIAAMRRLVNALDGLPDDATRRRVLTWLTDRYGHVGDGPGSAKPGNVISISRAAGETLPGD